MAENIGGRPLRIVGIHGVHHYQTKLSLAQAAVNYAGNWTGHLTRGLNISPDRLDLAFAYYAPALRVKRPLQQGGEDDDELDDELAERMLADYLAVLGAPQTIAQGARTIPLRNAADWISRRFPLTTKAFVRVFFREVAEYLRAPNHPPRLQARDIVADVIRQQRPEVVIAHSLGTIVAYEALNTIDDVHVPLLITLGSPLALPHAVHPLLLPAPVSDPVRGGRAFGMRPACIQRWINVADPGDPVAIPLRLSEGFDGVALSHTDTIDHDYGFHDAGNYLAAPATVATLAPYLGI